MLHDFLTLLKVAHGEFERISKELEGYTFKTSKKGCGKKKTVTEIEATPLQAPKYRVSPTLTNIILTFYPHAMVKRTAASTLQQIWEEELLQSMNDTVQTYVKIYELLQPFLGKFYLTEGGLSVGATIWRKPIKSKFGEKNDIYVQSVHILGLSQERSLAKRAEYKAEIQNRTSNRKADKYTRDFIYSVIDDAAQSSNPMKNLVAVLLATGSRTIEATRISTYEKVEGSDECVKVIGVAKDTEVDLVKVMIRPLIRLQVDKVLELISTVRKLHDFEKMTNKEASQAITSGLSKTVFDYFDILDILAGDSQTNIKKTTPHKLRHMWASLAYQLHGGVVPEQEWIRSMLGHSSGDTSLSYTQIVVSLEPIEGIPVATISDCREISAAVPNVLERETTSEIKMKYPQFSNPLRVRIGKDKQMDLLRELDRAYDSDSLQMRQSDAREHRFGSCLVSAYWKIRPAKFP
jgi:hypothetical protein